MNTESDHQENRGLVPPATVRSSSPNDKHIYLVTIKFHRMDHVTKEELDQELNKVVKRLPKADWSSVIAYEADSLHRMHLHTAVMCRRKPYFKKYQTPGVQIHFSSKKDSSFEAIYAYLCKQPQDGQSIINRFVANEGYWKQLKANGLTVPPATFRINFD